MYSYVLIRTGLPNLFWFFILVEPRLRRYWFNVFLHKWRKALQQLYKYFPQLYGEYFATSCKNFPDFLGIFSYPLVGTLCCYQFPCWVSYKLFYLVISPTAINKSTDNHFYWLYLFKFFCCEIITQISLFINPTFFS